MTTEEKVFHCIMCPMGCELRATVEDGVVLRVTGNQCPGARNMPGMRSPRPGVC